MDVYIVLAISIVALAVSTLSLVVSLRQYRELLRDEAHRSG